MLRRYDEDGDLFVPRYLDLLRSGGSARPEALLARVGLDITATDFWAGGVSLLEELLVSAEVLAEEVDAVDGARA